MTMTGTVRITVPAQKAHRPKFWTDDRIKQGLRASGNNLSKAAKWLSRTYGISCTRKTVDRALMDNPELRAYAEEIDAQHFDNARQTIINHAEIGNLPAATLFCKYEGHKHGYPPPRSTQRSGSHGGSTEHFEGLTREELRNMSNEELHERIEKGRQADKKIVELGGVSDWGCPGL